MTTIEMEIQAYGIDGDVVEHTDDYVIINLSNPKNRKFKIAAYLRINYHLIAEAVLEGYDKALAAVKKMVGENIAFILNRFSNTAVSVPSSLMGVPNHRKPYLAKPEGGKAPTRLGVVAQAR